ncbi:IS1182 family transposase [Paraglaciecola aquimarina]|uniref:IS1182 family transposase n=1 Tax=Paraglaciecola algarum TaxID=3050085 RepID=A0ABS9D6G4_9ALTE|nr:IS1182 family transposase [Paraglaciecola sp. G1-23]MCF2948511.1 IS1182 family transposase [Paraglaciecola sp. G1-23]
MSHHIKGQSRTQTTLFPEALDDFVTEDNPVRVIDVFVNEINLGALGFHRVQTKQTGRPCYHPATLLKLYIYGYLNRIQSSRRLEKETHRNVELMWLLERLSPDFKTIADFRKDNSEGIKNACRQFVELCRQMNMFSDAVFAIDGSKFKAVNNKSKNYTPKKVKFLIERVEKSIQQYLSQMDTQDNNEKATGNEVSASKLVWLKERLVELEALQKEVNDHPDKQISQTDPDSRLMQTHHMSRKVCYNVQTAVDTKHHLIVSHEVTNTPDRGQLTSVANQVQEVLKTNKITILADKGYYKSEDIKALQDTGAQALVPKGDTSGAEKKGIFNRSLFRYDKTKDVYICPADNELQYRCDTTETGTGRKLRMYFDSVACRDCKIRSQCTQSEREPRKIRRWIYEEILDKMQSRLEAAPDTAVTRKQTVEHPFGTIKMWMGSTHFLTKRFKNVSTEMSLHVLAYNLKRMMSIMGTQSLVSALKG